MSTLESTLITNSIKLWGSWQPNANSLPITNRLKAGQIVRVLGPCSTQSKEQMLAIAEVTAPHSDGLRGPDKKPRTRPVKPDGTPLFHGIGHTASKPIYESVTRRHPNLSLGVETMSEGDVQALAGLIGLAWSGSRTQEQESLQELGAAALQAKMLMMIKNPLTPDHEFYLGMMENWIIGAGYAIPFMACV